MYILIKVTGNLNTEANAGLMDLEKAMSFLEGTNAEVILTAGAAEIQEIKHGQFETTFTGAEFNYGAE